MIALAAAAALVLTDARFTGTASARVESRARTATGADSTSAQGAGAASDAEVTPSLFGAVDNLGGRIALSYSPTIRMREYYSNESYQVGDQQYGYRRTEVNHSQSFEARWSREGRPSPYLLENLYIGRVDLAAGRSTGDVTAVPPPPTGGDSTVPGGVNAVGFTTGQIYQTSLDFNGGVLWPLNRVMQLDTSVGYNYSSGLDQGARLVLPTQQSYRTQARLDYQLTPVDMLITQVDGRHSNFPGEQAMFTIANAAQRWRRQIIASTALELGLLVGAFYSSYLQPAPEGAVDQTPTRVQGTTFAPGGDAVIRHRTGSARHVVNLDTGVRVAPFIDRYVVAAFNRGELFTTLAYTFRERWIVSTRASAAMSLSPVAVRGVQSTANGGLPDIVTFAIDARAGYQAPRYWRLEAYGLDSLYMIDGGVVHNWIVGLALTLRVEGQT